MERMNKRGSMLYDAVMVVMMLIALTTVFVVIYSDRNTTEKVYEPQVLGDYAVSYYNELLYTQLLVMSALEQGVVLEDLDLSCNTDEYKGVLGIHDKGEVIDCSLASGILDALPYADQLTYAFSSDFTILHAYVREPFRKELIYEDKIVGTRSEQIHVQVKVQSEIQSLIEHADFRQDAEKLIQQCISASVSLDDVRLCIPSTTRPLSLVLERDSPQYIHVVVVDDDGLKYRYILRHQELYTALEQKITISYAGNPILGDNQGNQFVQFG